ncbi:MAG TPA: archaetidylserine decarboxylase [Vicinamibacterales bacterium]|jgi:phosphatidylserine decarboxylase
MSLPRALQQFLQQDDVNFVLTNQVPRRLLTRFMGWFSEIEQPVVRDISMAAWQLFGGDLNLHEAETTEFRSVHECFVRRLKAGARPVDQTAGVLVSPCDAIVGACGRLDGETAIQAKGFAYPLSDLLASSALVDRYRDGHFVTLRLTSCMYHRFHAPYDCDVDGIDYISGDMWNVNPVALRRVSRLFCKNERVVIDTRLRGLSESATLVAVGAILVGCICLTFVDTPLNLQYRGPNTIPCRASFAKGDEMGYFRHGSTILVFATRDLVLAHGVVDGVPIRMGEPLLIHA